MKKFNEIIKNIEPLDKEIMEIATARLDSLVKPIGSLGRLEDLAIQISGITGKLYNKFTKSCTVIMSADNGIWEEGFSAVPQFITSIQTVNFTKGGCGINVLSRLANMDTKIIDIGVNGDLSHPKIENRKIRKGTWNMSKGPAMTRDEAIEAIEIGIDVVQKLALQGYQIFGTGEMGICNTSTSSTILMAFTGCSVHVAVGKGTGLTEKAFISKKAALQRAIEINKPNKEDAIDVLSKVGGFDIAGLTGCYLGAAYLKIPIIIDGFISAAAALTAIKINPLTKEYMIPSHSSAEPGYTLLMKEIGLEPILNLNMRLGEGTGCPLVLNIVEAATKIIQEMATLEESMIPDDFLIDIR